MKGWENLDAIERQPDKVSGAWVFRGTRVPVTALFENLRDGATVDEFLEWFPPVQRSQVDKICAIINTTKLGDYQEISII
ncbi:MAG: DUF433 domain-containing protein [Dolichospermum sp.]|jgi:uncharacterized protein (DUF433 family)|nr:DUF433 domain-containing protein [Anabaena sp. 49628_E55]